MPAWIAVAEKEGGDAEELPAESDGTLLLASLTNLHSTVTTLKYKGPTGAWRVVKCVDGILTPPEDDGWGDHIYICVKKKEEPKEDLKRKAGFDGAQYDDGAYDPDDDERNWSKSILCHYVSDDASLTEEEFRTVFSKYGYIKSISVKPMRGNMPGSAFIAFDDSSIPMSLYGKDIKVGGVPVEVKEPESDDKERRKLVMIFRNEDLTKQEIRGHFEHYGRVTDIFIPKPFKYFGFVTFAKERICKSLYGEIHKYKGTELRLQEPRAAKEKREMREFGGGRGHWGGMGHMGGMGRDFGMGGGGGMHGNGNQFGGGYERPEKKQRSMESGGYGGRGGRMRDDGGMGGGYGRGQSANQGWKDTIESFGGSATSGGGSATKNWNPDSYGGYGGGMGGGQGGMGGAMPPGVHQEQKAACPFKLKNPDDKCPNFKVCSEYYEHGTSYCKYMKRQMDAANGMPMY